MTVIAVLAIVRDLLPGTSLLMVLGGSAEYVTVKSLVRHAVFRQWQSATATNWLRYRPLTPGHSILPAFPELRY